MSRRYCLRSLGRFFVVVAGPILAATAIAVSPSAAAQKNCLPQEQDIPRRHKSSLNGSELMKRLPDAGGPGRDAAIVEQVLEGNVPSHIRKLTPVSISGSSANGNPVEVIICVTPDYLAVGNDRDFVRVPLGLAAAARIADELGFFLPTTRMVDAIYEQASVRVPPSPMKPTNRMSSTAYLVEHDRTLDRQRQKYGAQMTDLAAGQKKDVVLTNRLRSKPGRVAIYGWHRTNGRPIQPLSTVHGAEYADYSHGIRLVSRMAYVNGRPRPLEDIMRDRELAAIVSSEGPIDNAAALMAGLY